MADTSNLVTNQPKKTNEGCCSCCFECTPCCPGGLAECCVIACANPCRPEPIGHPRTYMWFSVCCLLFNPLFGIFAIYYSCTARQARKRDDDHDHLIRGRCALLFIIWGFVFSIFVGLLVALILAMTPQIFSWDTRWKWSRKSALAEMANASSNIRARRLDYFTLYAPRSYIRVVYPKLVNTESPNAQRIC